MPENSLKTSRPAKVEYLAVKDQVEALLTKGYTVKDVYNHMREAGRIHVSYSAFCDYVRGQGQRRMRRVQAIGHLAEVAADQHQPAAFVREGERDGRAHALGRSGDQDDAAGEIEIHDGSS